MNNKTDMSVDEQLLAKLDSVNRTLEHIHRNLLWVFCWWPSLRCCISGC